MPDSPSPCRLSTAKTAISQTGQLTGKCSGSSTAIYTLQFSPDSSRLITAGFEGTVRVYDMTGKMVQDFVPVKVDKLVSQR